MSKNLTDNGCTECWITGKDSDVCQQQKFAIRRAWFSRRYCLRQREILSSAKMWSVSYWKKKWHGACQVKGWPVHPEVLQVVSLLQEEESWASISCQHAHLSLLYATRTTSSSTSCKQHWANLQSAAISGGKVVRLQPPPPAAQPSFSTVSKSEHPDEREEGR